MTRRGSRVAVGGGILLLFSVWAFPLYWMSVSSLTPEAALFGAPALVPREIVGEHYWALFTEREFWRPVRNSLIVAAATTGLAILLGAPCAYALARLRFPGRQWILIAILAVSMFPQIALVSPLFLILRQVGLIDTYAGLVLPYVTFAMPLAIWLMTGFFRELPRDVEDAARLDGAGPLRVATEITLPLAAPAIATTAILTFLFAWNEFLFALTLTAGPDRQTVPVAIALFRGQYQVPWGQVLAAAVVASVPVALIVVLFQRRIVRGLTAGAVKG
jgi:ABC-type glycerol-3-phosphate transport system permease component